MSGLATIVVIGGEETEEIANALRAEGISAVAVGSHAGILALIDGLKGPDGPTEKQDWVAVVDGDLPDQMGFDLYRALHQGHPAPTLTLVSAEKYEQFAHDSRRLPLDEYATKPLRVDELVLRIKALMLRSGFELPAPAPASTAETPEHRREGMRSGTVIAVMGAKGGIGKTTVAVNLADGLVRFHDQKTILVDADILFGDVGVLLNINSDKSLSDVCFGGDIDILRLQGALVTTESGLSVLLRPRELWVSEGLSFPAIVQAILTYKVLFDYVVVDTANTLNDLNVQLLQSADHVLLVTTPEITSIHHTARLLEVAENLGTKSRVSLILNRSGSGVPTGAIEAELGVAVAGTLVSAGRAVVEAANRGETLFAQDSRARHDITKQMRDIVDTVTTLDSLPGRSDVGATRTKPGERRSLLSLLGVR